MLRYISLVSVLFISACALPATKGQLASADYGVAMTQADCKRVAEQSIRYSLKDPDSAQFRHGNCRKGYEVNPLAPLSSHTFGYLQEGTVNARNSLGGYTGHQKYKVLMRNEQAVGLCIDYCGLRFR
jgi:hypothetical protein